MSDSSDQSQQNSGPAIDEELLRGDAKNTPEIGVKGQGESHELDGKPRVSLIGKQGRGGVIGARGYGFQAAYIVSRIPDWLKDDDFVQFLQEGAGDVDVRFDRAYGTECWYIQVKNHEVGVTEARKVFGEFHRMDIGSPGTYARFILACRGLHPDLERLRAAVSELRAVASFYRPGKNEILDSTREDLETLVENLKLPVDAAFLQDKVAFDTNLAGLTDDVSLRRLFVAALQELDSWAEVPLEGASRAYEKLALLSHRAIRETYSREQIEGIIREAAGKTTEHPPEYDDFVRRVNMVISDLSGSGLPVDIALHLTLKILDEAPWPATEIWESCRTELSREAITLGILLFKTEVEYELATRHDFDNTRHAVEALRELVNAYGDRPQILQKAADMRFKLAPDTAKFKHSAEKELAEAQFEEANGRLSSLYEKDFAITQDREKEKKQVQSEFERAKSRRDLSRGDYFEEETLFALNWAHRAQELDPDDISLRELIVEMWKTLIRSKLQRGKIRVGRAALRDRIKEHFSESDLRDVCFELNVSYEDLPGSERRDKARELVSYLERDQRIYELVEVCSRLRPNVSWWSYPKAPGGHLHSSRHLRLNILDLKE